MNQVARRPRPRIVVAALLSGAMLTAAGCGSRTDSPTEPSPTGGSGSKYEIGMINIPAEGTPVAGGTLAVGAWSEPRILDPATTVTAGVTGGNEMGAIYDVLVRWDANSKKLEPQLAESFQANADNTEFVLKLRPGVKFSDGSTLDAEAVKWSIERYLSGGSDEARMWQSNVTAMTVTDPLTVTFTVNKPWPTFGYLFNTACGMVVAKSAVVDGKFVRPVGAGPYVYTSRAEGAEMVLTARDDYWGGKPPIQTVRFVYLPDPTARDDSFAKGSLDLAIFRNPKIVDKYVDAKQPGYFTMVPLGRTSLINAAEGRPGNNPKVREAIVKAVDPQVVNQRAFGGAGEASAEIFPAWSQWHSDVAPIRHDPEAAKKLVAEAKAEGFDGTIKYTTTGDQSSKDAALAIQAQLEAVGFTVEIDPIRSVAELIKRVIIDRDYDMATSGMSWREAEPFARAYATLSSKGNPMGMKTSPEMDRLIDDLQQADTDQKRREIAGKIQQQWNTDIPALVVGPSPEYSVWTPKVHGLKSGINSMVLFDKAWKAS